jgi:hypothetical protein
MTFIQIIIIYKTTFVALVTEYVHGMTSLFSLILMHILWLHIYMAWLSLLFPSFAPFAIPFVLPLTYLAPSSCDELSSLLSGFL